MHRQYCRCLHRVFIKLNKGSEQVTAEEILKKKSFTIKANNLSLDIEYKEHKYIEEIDEDIDNCVSIEGNLTKDQIKNSLHAFGQEFTEIIPGEVPDNFKIFNSITISTED